MTRDPAEFGWINTVTLEYLILKYNGMIEGGSTALESNYCSNLIL